MASFAALTVNDYSATAHVFSPVSNNGREAIWRDGTAGLTVLSAPIISLVVLPSKDRSLERYRVKIVLPAVETITGSNAQGYTASPKLAYQLQVTADFVIPSRATEAQRKDLRTFLVNAVAASQISDTLFYGLRPI